MKIYMAYDSYNGPEEGAFLVFANNVPEAKVVSYPILSDIFSCDYIDIRVKQIHDANWLYDEMTCDEPHCIVPNYCHECNQWGHLPIGDDDLCEKCREEKENV